MCEAPNRMAGKPAGDVLLDNDFFGNPAWSARLDEIRRFDLRVNFNQGTIEWT